MAAVRCSPPAARRPPPAARRPIVGRDHVVNLLLGIRRTAPSTGVALESVTLDIAEVNGELALVLRVAGQLDGVYVMTVEDDAIAAIRVVRNPDKLTYLAGQLGGYQ